MATFILQSKKKKKKTICLMIKGTYKDVVVEKALNQEKKKIDVLPD